MPMTWSMGSPSSDSRSGRTSGMPPPTAASNSTSTPDASAVANTSAPTLASSSLLAVTTGLPALSASRMSWRAGSMPPITSITTSMSGSLTTDGGVVGERGRGAGRRRGPWRRCAPPPGRSRGAGRCGTRCPRPAPAAAGRARSPPSRTRADRRAPRIRSHPHASGRLGSIRYEIGVGWNNRARPARRHSTSPSIVSNFPSAFHCICRMRLRWPRPGPRRSSAPLPPVTPSGARPHPTLDPTVDSAARSLADVAGAAGRRRSRAGRPAAPRRRPRTPRPGAGTLL